jgi:CheY-like chemotaxis protein
VNNTKPIHILLADDDPDDRFFFKLSLEGLPFSSSLSTVSDGEQLMQHLDQNSSSLPDILFLDLNMPKKNGFEALTAIRRDATLKDLPVVIYSTHYDEQTADQLYRDGANFYIRKTDVSNLKMILHDFFSTYSSTSFSRPQKDDFVFSA